LLYDLPSEETVNSLKEKLSRLGGVTEVKYDPQSRFLDVEYSGNCESLSSIESTVSFAKVRCALVSPVALRFRSNDGSDSEALLSAVRETAGVYDVIKEPNTLRIYADLEVLDLQALDDAAKRSGSTVTIISHDTYSFTLKADESKKSLDLVKELHSTEHVLGVRYDEKTRTLGIVSRRGRITRDSLKEVARLHGLSIQ